MADAKPFEPTGVAADVLAFMRRRLTPKAPRQVSIQLGPFGDDPERNPLDRTTSQHSLQRRINSLSNSLGRRAFEAGRRERIVDYREIAEEVPELARGLEVVVDFVFGGGEGEGPELVFADNARADVKRIAQGAWDGLGIPQVGRGMIHEGMWLGDSFTQGIFSFEDRALVAERHWRPELVTIYERAGILSHYEVDQGSAEPIKLHPFEVVHYAHTPLRGAAYGRSLWHSARGVRRHHEAVGDTATFLALRRASGDVYWLWPFPAELDDEKLDDWIAQAQEYGEFDVVFDSGGNLRKRAAATVETGPRPVPYRVVDGIDTKPEAVVIPPTNLSQMVELLEYLQDRFFISAGIPKALIGLERDVNSRATLEQQGLHFALTIQNRKKDAQRVMEAFIWRALLAAGVIPNPDEVRVEMPGVSALDEAMRASVAKDRAQAVKDLVDAGVPVEFALRSAGGVSDEDVESVADDLARITTENVRQELAARAG